MAGLLKESTIRKILLSKKITFFLPEYALNELEKYKEELCDKSDYSKEELETLIELLLENIELIPKEKISICMNRAEKIMKNIDIKDAPFIATCLAVNADGIFSFDKHFMRQKIIKTFKINELTKEF